MRLAVEEASHRVANSTQMGTRVHDSSENSLHDHEMSQLVKTLKCACVFPKSWVACDDYSFGSQEGQTEVNFLGKDNKIIFRLFKM